MEAKQLDENTLDPTLYESDSDAEADEDMELPEALKPDGSIAPIRFEMTNHDDEEAVARRKAREEEEQEKLMIKDERGRPIIPLIAIEDDVHRVPGQNYACVSAIKPEYYNTLHHGDRKYKGLLLKVRGIFATREEADEWIRNRIMPLDSHFDVHLIKCHSWSGLDEDNVEENDYVDDDIKRIMSNYFEGEHNKMLGLQARVEMAQKKTKRTKEAGNFYRDAVASAAGKEVPSLPPLPEHLPDVPQQSRPFSLDEIRSRMLSRAKPGSDLAKGIAGAKSRPLVVDRVVQPKIRQEGDAMVMSTTLDEIDELEM